MNVLIVSENFLDGGLETQINSTVQSLKEKINFFFAFRNYKEKWNFQNVYTDFYFSNSSTISQFCYDVDKLVQIIKENNIDVIHAHPFYSLFPAVFAAKICEKPIIYTYHGIGSYSFTDKINNTLLFNMLLDYEINKIFCVSKEGTTLFENCIFEKDKIVFLPNSIDTEKFIPAQKSNNKSWALISRLDDDKINEIKKLITILHEIDIQELHIFGDGSKKEFLQEFIQEKNLTNKVFFEGHCDNLNEKLSNNFNGIFGIGRVAMESISMEFPTILIGYNKIAGLIDTNMYNIIKKENFTTKNIKEISTSMLRDQIQQVYNDTYDRAFYNSFKNEFSTTIISDLYYNELKSINYSSLLNLKDLYNEIKLINNDESFYDSFVIYSLFRKYFSLFVRQPHQQNLFILGDSILTQKHFNDIINTQTNNLNEQINNFSGLMNNKIKEHEKQFNNLSEHTMTIKNLKRKLKYKFNKKSGV